MKTVFGFEGEYVYASSLTEANLMVAANIGFLPTASKIKEKEEDGSITSLPFFRNGEVLVTKYYAYYKKSFDESIYEKFISILKEVLN